MVHISHKSFFFIFNIKCKTTLKPTIVKDVVGVVDVFQVYRSVTTGASINIPGFIVLIPLMDYRIKK